ncbi:MAG: D-tyrosyl-tRNA(Tyr) deacylase [Bacteroidales bacterium]|nr:D-tyrosyl-tRNA(Tyr) deacylase [Bacteroidales bacterium]
MRIIIQRTKRSSVSVNGKITGEIGKGMMILLGIEEADDNTDIEWLVHKIIGLRIFDDEKGVMNLSVSDINGDILLVSQFTLHASTKKGNRPSYIRAARPEKAIVLYEEFIRQLSYALGKSIQTGIFGSMMEVDILNDGPVTIIIDSKNKE